MGLENIFRFCFYSNCPDQYERAYPD